MPEHVTAVNTINRLGHAPVRRILAEVWLGAERIGVERGAVELSDGIESRWSSNRLLPAVEIPNNAPPDARAHVHRRDLSFLSEICAANEAIAGEVERAIRADELALVLGGDHAIALGSLAGAAGACERLGVLWLDAHLDLNTPETSPTGHIHGMPLAVALGLGPSELTEIGRPGPKLDPSRLAVLGIRDIDAGETALVEREGIWTRTMDEWTAGGIIETLNCALVHLSNCGADAIHVSFDVDVLDPTVMPGTGTAVPNGLSMKDARSVIKRLRCWDAPLRSFDLVELNSSLDPSGRSADAAISLLLDLLGAD
jgi:arginase